MAAATLLERIDAALPQTQCTRCGYADCHAYAQAVTQGEAINRCPPGGAQGVQRLAQLTGRQVIPLDARCGVEGPRRIARIDESACIGCTLCIQACPVDAIAGAPRRMHSVLADWCTGCELCLAPCPTDCIRMLPAGADPQATGWQAWSADAATLARSRYEARRQRLATPVRQLRDSSSAANAGASSQPRPDAEAAQAQAHRQARIRAALERAQARQATRRV